MNKTTNKTTNKITPRRSRRQRPRFTRAANRTVRWLAGNAAFLLLALAVLFGLGVMALAAHNNTPNSNVAGAPQTALPSGWIHLASHSPADILAAARQSPLLRANAGSDTGGDHSRDFSRLGTPILVRALRTAAYSAMPDFYIVPVLNASGQTTDAVELQLDAAHSAVHVIAIVTYTQPRPAGRVATVDSSAAVVAVGKQHHIALRSGSQPALVYIPMDPSAAQNWKGGGASPVDPLWLVPGADGQSHILGDDGKVYFLRNLPGAPQLPSGS